MAFVPVADTAKLALLFTQFGQKLVNTMWFSKSGGWSASDLNSLCVAVNSWVIAEMLPAQNDSVTFNGSEAVDMSSEGQEGVSVQQTAPNTGGLSIGSFPGNVTAAIKFLTGFTGRSNRGRNYFVGLDAGSVTGDTIGAPAVASLLSIYDSLASYLVGLTAEHVVASLYSGIDEAGHPVPRVAGVVHAVTSYAMDNLTDSMRKRLAGRGT